MDRDLEALESAPPFSYKRLWVALVASAAVIGAGSLLVRTFPNSGHQAGYEAVITKGEQWAQAEVDAANGAALPACDQLQNEAEASPASPNYEYQSFVEGCDKAIDQLMGRDVPLLAHGE